MVAHPQIRKLAILSGTLLLVALQWQPLRSDEKRAPAPNFSKSDTQGIFFDSVEQAIRGQRPALSALRAKSKAANVAANQEEPTEDSAGSQGPWDGLISAVSLEDEIKRRKLHYDSLVTQPGPFKSGGYQDARLDLMVMASLFAIISEYDGQVRWKEESAAARDLLARSAFNFNSGTNQIFNEAQARKNDLQDLISGSGLRGRKAEEGNDWATIADRSPLMEYAESLTDQLSDATNSEDNFKQDPVAVRRPAELLAVLGRILVQEGMDQADDEDYAALSTAMTDASLSVRRGLELDDYDAVSKAIGDVTQSCDNCHAEYR
jgi:hypothetical protein